MSSSDGDGQTLGLSRRVGILPQVKISPLTILLALVLAVHATAGGMRGAAVLCLGGGHQHGQVETEHCESACGHDARWPLPVPSDDHEHECECTDVELTIVEMLTLPRGDDEGNVLPAIVASPAWSIVVAEAGLGRRGPPSPPPWFDPAGDRRLAIVASVRLTI